MDYLETTDITIIDAQKQQIPGYNIILILLTFSAAGLIIITKKSQISKKK